MCAVVGLSIDRSFCHFLVALILAKEWSFHQKVDEDRVLIDVEALERVTMRGRIDRACSLYSPTESHEQAENVAGKLCRM